MVLSFLNQFDVILLDVGHTFMFGGYRFFDRSDFAATYRQLGGSLLTEDKVNNIIFRESRKIKADGKNPNYYDCLPPVLSYLQQNVETTGLPAKEFEILEQVFATHEVGVISQKHAEILHKLRETHRLGIISNIWSKKDLFLKEFDRVGIRDLFEIIVFSSDYGWIKPSIKIFEKAIEYFNVDHSKIVYIGDHIMRDVGGASAAGLSTIWINRRSKKLNENMTVPDLIIKDLQELR